MKTAVIVVGSVALQVAAKSDDPVAVLAGNTNAADGTDEDPHIVYVESGDGDDTGYSINGITASYNAETSTDLTGLMQQADLLETIRSNLEIALGHCEDTKLQLQTQATVIEQRMLAFENTLGAMGILVNGSSTDDSLSGLVGAQTALVNFNKLSAQLSLQIKTVWDNYIATGSFATGAEEALLTYTQNNPLASVATVADASNSECFDPAAADTTWEEAWAYMQATPCAALADAQYINEHVLGVGTSAWDAAVADGSITWETFILEAAIWDLATTTDTSGDGTKDSTDEQQGLAIPLLEEGANQTLTVALFDRWCSYEALAQTDDTTTP